MALPVRLGALRRLVKELESSARVERPLVVGGAAELARVLERELARDARPSAVRVGDPAGAALYVHVAGAADDEEALRRARRARVPIVAVVTGPAAEEVLARYVLATDVVRVEPGHGFPLDRIARVVARRLGEEAAPLAARLPVLREAVCEQIVASYARKNGLVGAAFFVPGADLPVLALNQARMVLRLAQAHGRELGREQLPELAVTLGAGLGLRAVARELLDLVPVAGWAVKGAVAYAGTRSLGAAAIRRFAAGAEGPTPPRDAAGRAAP